MRPYNHFTTEHRFCLADGKLRGKSNVEIARILGCHPSSVGREFKRNQNKHPGANGLNYNPAVATNRNKERRRKNSIRKPRLQPGTELFAYVCEKLNRFWSPEEITNEWKRMHPGETLSASTIYRAVKKGMLPGINAHEHLRRRGKRKHGQRSKYNTIHPEHTIHERPEIVEKRGRVGDWEGDTVAGGVGKGYLLTLVERRGRLLVSEKLMTLNAEEVARTAIQALKASGVPVKTITFDNGSEFASYKKIEKELGATIYFADPHSPWQRGTNECYNDRLRFFFPRGTDLREMPEEVIANAVDLINDRSRKCLGHRSAYEVIREALNKEKTK